MNSEAVVSEVVEIISTLSLSDPEQFDAEVVQAIVDEAMLGTRSAQDVLINLYRSAGKPVPSFAWPSYQVRPA